MLKNQLSDAKDRELFYQNQIETMQRLLEAPKVENIRFTDSNLEPQNSIEEPQASKHEVLTTEPQSPRKRLFGRLFNR